MASQRLWHLILAAAVVIGHISLLHMLTAISGKQNTTPPQHTLMVHTVQLAPPPSKVAFESPPVHTTPNSPSLPSQPNPPKKAKLLTTPKTIPRQDRVATNKDSSRTKQLDKLRQQLAAIGELKIDNQPIPPPVGCTHTPLKVSDDEYVQELAKCLQRALKLPEYGSVRVELEILRDGSVASVRVLETHSELNKSYVMTTLPTLRLNPLMKQRETFTLTIENR